MRLDAQLAADHEFGLNAPRGCAGAVPIGTADAWHGRREADRRLDLRGKPLTQAGTAFLVEDGLFLKLSQRFKVKGGRFHRPSARLTSANA